VYPPVIALAQAAYAGLGIRLTVEGAGHVPRTGGAVIACNHVSYLDFVFCGQAAVPSRRFVRFMCKESVFRHPVGGFLMRGMHHIPVDRSAGAGAFERALEALRSGEIVGVFPEATISRSFTVKEFKTGATRMAAAAGVPLIPVAVWGSQRLYTKDHRKDFSRGKAVSVAVGEPWLPAPDADPQAEQARLRSRVGDLLDGLQRRYPDQPAGPEDRWWLPAHLGGDAPTPEQAAAMDEEERQARNSRERKP
jgi:1-acyl-sn-glycerol-3-phosphate acyltransferase